MLAKKQQTELERQGRASGFVPFACHYSADTILSKNGELIQVIKLDQDAGANDEEFRQLIRDSLNEVIDPAKYAVWIHTTRTLQQEKKLSAQNFSRQVELDWRRQLPKKLQFENVVYISIMRDSSKMRLFRPDNFLAALNFSAVRGQSDAQLQERYAELSAVMGHVHKRLQKFGANKLQVYEKDGVYYSEQMEFLRKILSFYDDHIEMPISDLAHHLLPEDIVFNEFSGVVEINNPRGKHYAHVISLKECGRLPARSLDYLLNLPSELVICQSLDFAAANTMLHRLKFQEEIDATTEDSEFSKLAGFHGVDLSKSENFVLQQTNIIIMEDSPALLRDVLVDVHRELARLGLVGITEDIKVEKAFWSAITGNFPFLDRQDIAPRKDIGNFAILGNDIYQEVDASLFGDPVVFFERQDGEPFAFHLVNNGSSNVLIVSEYEEERLAMLHLLAVHLKKFPCKIVYYDEKGAYASLAQEIGAEYMTSVDFDRLRQLAEGSEKLVILFNSMDLVINGFGLEFFNNFLEFLGENNSLLIGCGKYVHNHVEILPAFDSQIYFHTPEIKKYADNFELYDDEVKIILFVEGRYIYLRHQYEEHILKFNPNEKFKAKLLSSSQLLIDEGARDAG